jgi:predicted GIY-YIG superfamily endonuclease
MKLTIGRCPWQHSLYIIGAGDRPVKIGYAKNPSRRLAELQTGSPGELYIFEQIAKLTLKEARAVERKAHEHFKDRRLKGEWFDITTEEAREAVWQWIDVRVTSARVLSGLDLRAHTSQEQMLAIAQIADRDITNGCSI